MDIGDNCIQDTDIGDKHLENPRSEFLEIEKNIIDF